MMLKERKRAGAIGFAVFVVLETTAVLIGIWPLFRAPAVQQETTTDIRLGIMPAHSEARSHAQWMPIATALAETTDIRLRPYYANTIEEAITGLTSKSLDVVKINPFLFRELEGTHGIIPLLTEGFRGGPESNRTVLVCRRGDAVQYVEDTRGLRLTLVDPRSLTGFVVPDTYLRGKLPVEPEEWFSSVTFSGTHHQALINLLRHETDVISVGNEPLRQSMQIEGHASETIRILWTSHAVPADVYCTHRDVSKSVRDRLARGLLTQAEKSGHIIVVPYTKSLIAADVVLNDGSTAGATAKNAVP